MSLSIRNATPKDLQMKGIYFHIFEQIMSSSEIYHIFDVSLSTYFFAWKRTNLIIYLL